MDWIIPVGIIVLTAIVHAMLQLGLGTLLLLYHASMGKHVKKKTKSLVSSYISGVGMTVFLGVCAICFMLVRFFEGALAIEWLMILVGVLAALALAVWLFYYRWGKGTELWIPKVVARYVDGRAKVTDNNTESFALGVLVSFAELPFSLALFTVAANSVLMIDPDYQLVWVAIYTLIVIMPMLIMRFAVRRGKTVVDVQRWRVKNKNFLKIMSGVGFAVLAVVVLAFQILADGA